MRAIAFVGMTGVLAGAVALEGAAALMRETRRRQERDAWRRSMVAMSGQPERRRLAVPIVRRSPISLAGYRERTLAYGTEQPEPRSERLEARAA